MLTKFEQAAVLLKPFRLKFISAMVIVLVGGFFFAIYIDQTTARLVRSVAMTLAWWLWLLFLIPRWFAPENRAAVENSTFPRLAGLLRGYFMAFMILAFVFPLVAPIILRLYN